MKKFIISSVAIFALAFTASIALAATAEDMGTMTIKSGVPASYVMGLQKNLNVCAGATLAADGKYGPKTTAAVKAFQMSTAGLTVDGKAGPMTKAALVNKCNGVTGTVSTVPGCGIGAMYSSTTGALCSGSTTTTTTSGSEGYLADISSDSTNRVSTVYESEQDKVVIGARATARLADQTISRVTVKFHQTNQTSTTSANLAKYISGVSLWSGSTKLATMSVADASRDNSNDTYTFQFTGFNAVIPKDQVGRLYVSVNANGALDTTDTTNAKWWVTIPSDGIRATSPNGVYATASMTAIQVGTDSTAGSTGGLSFGKFSANGVKAEISLSSGNPASAVIPVNATTATNGQEILRFKIKATNSNLTLRKVPVQITLSPVAASDDVINVINTLKLVKDGTTVDTMDGSSGYQFTAGSASNFSGTACTDSDNTAGDFCSYAFSNLSGMTINAGSTAEFSVVADFKTQSNYSTGVTVTAALAGADVTSSSNLSVLDANGDQLTGSSTYRTGSAVGNVQTLRVTGLQVGVGSSSVAYNTRGGTTYSNDVVRATITMPVTLQSFGQTLYVGQAALYAAAATGTTTTAKTLSFGIQKASAPTTTVNSGALDTNVSVATTAPTFTCNAPVEGSYGAYRIDSGAAPVNCTLTVTLNNTGTGATTATESYRAQLNDVRFFTSNDLTTGAANQSLLPASSYQSVYANGVSTSA